jgi:UDP-N-acetylglucosamine 2-epimerase (non-hydrolysing)
MKIILVAGARPNFMKIAPIVHAIKSFNQTNHTNQRNQINQRNLIDYKLVHTGQHYDYEMSKVFFEDLEIPEPDIYLGVGSGTHAEQTGKVKEIPNYRCLAPRSGLHKSLIRGLNS